MQHTTPVRYDATTRHLHAERYPIDLLRDEVGDLFPRLNGLSCQGCSPRMRSQVVDLTGIQVLRLQMHPSEPNPLLPGGPDVLDLTLTRYHGQESVALAFPKVTHLTLANSSVKLGSLEHLTHLTWDSWDTMSVSLKEAPQLTHLHLKTRDHLSPAVMQEIVGCNTLTSLSIETPPGQFIPCAVSGLLEDLGTRLTHLSLKGCYIERLAGLAELELESLKLLLCQFQAETNQADWEALGGCLQEVHLDAEFKQMELLPHIVGLRMLSVGECLLANLGSVIEATDGCAALTRVDVKTKL